MRTYAYIDGFNLYFGLRGICNNRSPWRWLDLEKWLRSQIPRDYEIERIRYFTAHIKPGDGSKARRQKRYLRALRTTPVVVTQLGSYETHRDELPLCDEPKTKVCVIRHEEKRSDVNLACRMILDAFVANPPIEAAVVVSNDSDLLFPIKTLRKKGIPVGVLNPHPEKPSGEMQDNASFYRLVEASKVLGAQFPLEMEDDAGVFPIPDRWL
jgi:hypothetical protein